MPHMLASSSKPTNCTCVLHALVGTAGQRLSIGATCLNGHVLSGEERWAVQWQKCDDSVWCAPVIGMLSRYAFKADHVRKVGASTSCTPALHALCIRRYEVYAYSKPDSLLAWVAYPLCRYYQQKFRRDSASKMIEVLR